MPRHYVWNGSAKSKQIQLSKSKGVKSMLLETQRAFQYDYEIYRVCLVVKLQTIPCHIEFVFGISYESNIYRSLSG